MRIGLDFDNTIVSYDSLFYKVALEQGVIPGAVPQSKLAVRDHLRSIGQEDVWTEMQGYVYGARMDEAAAYPGVLDFLHWARGEGHELAIISHKTLHPFIGPKYDLHEAARRWAASHLERDGVELVAPSAVFFELTKGEKIRRIADTACDYYVDDLPEILLDGGFPSGTRRVLFDPDGHHQAVDSVTRVRDWREALEHFQRECRTTG